MNSVVAKSMMLVGIAVLALGATPSCRSQAYGHVTRVIEDAATGDHWLLVKDASNPGGPGRMVRVGRAAVRSAIHPMIHAGDALIVEEHTAVVDARLEAMALGSAAAGMEFDARLKIGGKVVRVVALAPGSAMLEPERKAQP